jgi:PPOX class probable F420-dependent enzyme
MDSDLNIEDLAEFLDKPVVATLATYGADGRVRLSPVWCEWGDDAFNVVVDQRDIKARHLRRDPRASLAVYSNEPPYRGVEVRTEARLILDGAADVERRLALRYLGVAKGERFLASADWHPLLVRLEPGELRIWDYPDY